MKLIHSTHTKQKRTGSGLLAMAVILCFITSLTALASARLSNSMFSAVQTNKINLGAQEYAQIKAVLLRATPYDKLKAESKSAIEDSGYYQQVTLGEEVVYKATNSKSKKLAINIFYGSETTPRFTINLTRSVWTSTGCPIGSIVAWPSDKMPTDGGVWLRCEGNYIPEKYVVLRALVGSTAPDFRGKFLRGYDNRSSIHTTAPLLDTQQDTVQELQGSFYTYVPQYIANDPYTNPQKAWKTGYTEFNPAIMPTSGVFLGIEHPWEDTRIDRQDVPTTENYTYSYKINFSNASGNIRLATEVRPINTAVIFLIKAQ